MYIIDNCKFLRKHMLLWLQQHRQQNETTTRNYYNYRGTESRMNVLDCYYLKSLIMRLNHSKYHAAYLVIVHKQAYWSQIPDCSTCRTGSNAPVKKLLCKKVTILFRWIVPVHQIASALKYYPHHALVIDTCVMMEKHNGRRQHL